MSNKCSIANKTIEQKIIYASFFFTGWVMCGLFMENTVRLITYSRTCHLSYLLGIFKCFYFFPVYPFSSSPTSQSFLSHFQNLLLHLADDVSTAFLHRPPGSSDGRAPSHPAQPDRLSPRLPSLEGVVSLTSLAPYRHLLGRKRDSQARHLTRAEGQWTPDPLSQVSIRGL